MPSATTHLANRAAHSPHDPWLFYNEGWDWPWRPWSHVADQVARGAEILDENLPANARVGYDGTQDPDDIAVGLAIEASGQIAVPVVASGPRALEKAAELDCVAWAQSSEDDREAEAHGALECVVLPTVHGLLDDVELRSLDLQRITADPSPEVEQLDDLLPGVKKRHIVCVDPSLDLETQRHLRDWMLYRNAAWVLEPEAEELLPTVLWARPTLVVASEVRLRHLAKLLEPRKARRASRLAAVVCPGTVPSDLAKLWESPEIPLLSAAR